MFFTNTTIETKVPLKMDILGRPRPEKETHTRVAASAAAGRPRSVNGRQTYEVAAQRLGDPWVEEASDERRTRREDLATSIRHSIVHKAERVGALQGAIPLVAYYYVSMCLYRAQLAWLTGAGTRSSSNRHERFVAWDCFGV